MTRFSLGREDYDSDDMSPLYKRNRIDRPLSPSPPPQNPNRNSQQTEEEEEPPFDFDQLEEEIEEEEEEDDEEEEEEVEEEEERGETSLQTVRSSTGDGPISVILSDPDVLDCPICLEPLTLPVFQCENGHVACDCCCSKLKKTCPSCSRPIGYNRCRAIEKVIESIKISCQNSNYGCKETVPYSKKHDHEHVCLHAPVSCPNISCTFVSSFKKLYQHFSSQHSDCATRFSYNKIFSVSLMRGEMHEILQEKNEGVIFILNIFRENIGTLVNVECIGPTTTKRGYSYDLTAKKGENSVVLHSVTENVANWVQHIPKKAFLVVPREFDGPLVFDGSLVGISLFKLEVCIRRPSENSAGT